MLVQQCSYIDVSIHAPREGSDYPVPFAFEPAVAFQSTLPARGATPEAAEIMGRAQGFNPRSPRGERPSMRLTMPVALIVSIHAPREGSDGYARSSVGLILVFQSTLPARGATVAIPVYSTSA